MDTVKDILNDKIEEKNIFNIQTVKNIIENLLEIDEKDDETNNCLKKINTILNNESIFEMNIISDSLMENGRFYIKINITGSLKKDFHYLLQDENEKNFSFNVIFENKINIGLDSSISEKLKRLCEDSILIEELKLK